MALAFAGLILVNYHCVSAQNRSSTEAINLPFGAKIVRSEYRLIRRLYVLLDSKHFNAKDLKTLFVAIAKQFPTPQVMDVFVGSSKEAIAIELQYADQVPRKENGVGLMAKYIRSYYDEYFYYIVEPVERITHLRTISNKARINSGLIEAINYGYEERFDYLLEHGANINEVDQAKTSPLMWACIQLQYDFVERLLDRGAIIDQKDDEGLTALMYAAIAPTTTSLKLLIAAHADLNLKDIYGNTALINAIIAGRLGNVVELLKSGADKTIRSKKGESALDVARNEKKEKMIELLDK